MLIPGISSDIVVSRILLTLSGRYRCLTKEITPCQARQEVLANTHLQIREIDAYIKAFLADLSTRATSLSSHVQPGFVATHFLTHFGPTADALLGYNIGLVPVGLTAGDLPPAGSSSTLPSKPAARSSLLNNVASVSFCPTTSAPARSLLEDSSPHTTAPPTVVTAPYPPWPPYPTFTFGSPTPQLPYPHHAPAPTPPPPPAYTPWPPSGAPPASSQRPSWYSQVMPSWYQVRDCRMRASTQWSGVSDPTCRVSNFVSGHHILHLQPTQ